MFLVIENEGVAPKEAYTLMGASTARGEAGSIGQFGTGAKHAIALLLRNAIKPIVCLGEQTLVFGSQTIFMGEKKVNQVTLTIDGVKSDLGFVVELGEIDWDNLDMAIREFISNAIDQSDGLACRVDMMATVEPVADMTRVYISLTPEVMEFYTRLNKWFLHFTGIDTSVSSVIPLHNRAIEQRDACVVYRKGVRVREVGGSQAKPIWDYNINDLEIDECRKASTGAAQRAIARTIAQAPDAVINEFMQALKSDNRHMEFDIYSSCYIDELRSSEQKVRWRTAFHNFFGDSACVCELRTLDRVRRKGFNPVILNDYMRRVMRHVGVTSDLDVLSADVMEGREIHPEPDPVLDAEINRLWNIAWACRLTNSKHKPQGRVFTRIMDEGSQELGFYRDGTIYVNADQIGQSDSFTGTVLEEMVHHITGSGDLSRDFQDYLIKFTVLLMKEQHAAARH